MGSGPGRAATLNQTRARRLAQESSGADGEFVTSAATDFMVALTHPHAGGFALLMGDGAKSFGSAVLWAAGSGVVDLTLMADPTSEPGDQARRALSLDPRPTVWAVDGASLRSVEPSRNRSIPAPVDGVSSGVQLMNEAGLEVSFVEGIAVGEYLGLEVARAVLHDGECVVEVGVGSLDREANRVLHPDETEADLLSSTVEEVAKHRRPGVVGHPLATLARERWMLKSILADSSLLEVDNLREVPSPRQSRGLRDPMVAGAIGEVDGRVYLVVVGTGSDPAELGDMADMIEREAPDELVVVPMSGMVPSMERALARFRVPASCRRVPAPWA